MGTYLIYSEFFRPKKVDTTSWFDEGNHLCVSCLKTEGSNTKETNYLNNVLIIRHKLIN